MLKIVKLLISIVIVVSVCGLPVGYGFAANLPNFVAINYGPFHKDGQSPGTLIPDSQYIADLGIMAQKFTYIKTYGVDTASGLDRVVPLASANFPALKIFLGVYEEGSNHDTVTKPQLDLAISQANNYPNTVRSVVVGNECLSTDSNPDPVTVAQLIADLQYVRNGITNKDILVTTCLGYQSAQTYGSQLMPYCDVMMVNIYPFYGQVDIAGAWNNLANAYQTFANQFFGKQMIVGETGWPSQGPSSGSAVPSIDNEQTCTSQILDKASQLGPIFVFEAFDEPWKSENDWAAHWGIWDKSGAPKFNFGTTLTRDASWLEDQNGNGVGEVALLRQDLDKGETQVHIKDGQTGNQIKVMHFFGSGWTPVALVRLPDLNSNGSQELAVLAFHERIGTVRVIIKDTATGGLISKIDFDNDFKAKELMVRGDNHIAVLGTNPVNNMSQVEVRGALDGALVKKIRVFNEHY
jgi:exo-beta-1,3-glucanase (GH17 family)